MLFVTTASQHFLSAAIDSLSNPTPPARWSHFSQRDMQEPSHSNDDTPFHKMLMSTVTKYTVSNFKQITFDIFKQKGIVWAGLSRLLWQADRDARAVEASTRRMEVLKPGAEFLRGARRRASKVRAVAGGHWWQNVMTRIGSPCCIAAAWLTSWPSIWQWRWSQESVASKRQQRRPAGSKAHIRKQSKTWHAKRWRNQFLDLRHGAKDDGRCQASRCWVLGLCQKMRLQ